MKELNLIVKADVQGSVEAVKQSLVKPVSYTHLDVYKRQVIDSAATSREEIGNPPHRGTVNKLRELGIPLVPHLSLIHI